MKIDRSFVNGLGGAEDAFDRPIVDAIIKMAQSLHLDVVAEGVETPSNWSPCKHSALRAAQGFLWSPPLPEQEVPIGSPLVTRHCDCWMCDVTARSAISLTRSPKETGTGVGADHYLLAPLAETLLGGCFGYRLGADLNLTHLSSPVSQVSLERFLNVRFPSGSSSSYRYCSCHRSSASLPVRVSKASPALELAPAWRR